MARHMLSKVSTSESKEGSSKEISTEFLFGAKGIGKYLKTRNQISERMGGTGSHPLLQLSFVQDPH